MDRTYVSRFNQAAIATALVLIANTGSACLEIPQDPPPVWVVPIAPGTALVILHDYTTYGATAGDNYCACALNIPAQFGIVVSAEIRDAVTNLPLPGFSFGENGGTGSAFNDAAPLGPPEFWSGFSSAVSELIEVGTPVDLVFTVTDPKFDVDLGQLADHLRNAPNVVATDAADIKGIPTGQHQAILSASNVSISDIDSDGDGVVDVLDNCTLVANPDQLDSDGDWFGNACDPDLDNNCVINVLDLALFRLLFFTSDPNADFNGDGVVNIIDLGIFRTFFFRAPGPSGHTAACQSGS